jgi:uncharacterized membrane protein
MKKISLSDKRFWTILLALTGIAVMIAYFLCLGSCSYLKGDIFGIDLKYLGIFNMAVVAALALLQKPLLLLLLLAFGVGGELFLVGFQVQSGVYCPFCLVFGAAILAAFAINFDARRKAAAVLGIAAGLTFFLLFFSGSATPAFAQGPVTTAFGRGAVEVRVYTDYFCEPCQAEEEEVSSLIKELIQKDTIRVIFIDTPIHNETVLYVGYFLAALNARGDFQQAITARAVLFEAAAKKIVKKEPLEAFLKAKGLKTQTVDPAPSFKTFTNYLQEDRINSTPTFVILGPKGKQTLTGKENIVKGLRDLLK